MIRRETLADLVGAQIYVDWDDAAMTTDNPSMRLWSVGLMDKYVYARLFNADGSVDRTIGKPDVPTLIGAELDIRFPGSRRLVKKTTGRRVQVIAARRAMGQTSSEIGAALGTVVFDDDGYLTSGLSLEIAVMKPQAKV